MLNANLLWFEGFFECLSIKKGKNNVFLQIKTLRGFVLKVFSSSAAEAAALRLSSVEAVAQKKGAFFLFLLVSFSSSSFFSLFLSLSNPQNKKPLNPSSSASDLLFRAAAMLKHTSVWRRVGGVRENHPSSSFCRAQLICSTLENIYYEKSLCFFF